MDRQMLPSNGPTAGLAPQTQYPPRYPLGYGTCLLAGMLAILGGCTHLGPGEKESLRLAVDLYAKHQTAEAIERLDRLIRDFPGAIEISEAYYLRGLCRTTRGDFPGASEDFAKAIESSKRTDLTARCQASLAALAYRNAAWSKAAELYAKAVEHLPDEPPTDEILYRAGLAMQRSGQWAEARRQFARILWKFRQRPIAAEARRMALWKYDYFAIQLGAYINAAQAEQAEQAFRSKGLDAVRMENQPRNGSALWVVMSGRYPTYRDAVATLPRVQRVEPSACIIP